MRRFLRFGHSGGRHVFDNNLSAPSKGGPLVGGRSPAAHYYDRVYSTAPNPPTPPPRLLTAFKNLFSLATTIGTGVWLYNASTGRLFYGSNSETLRHRTGYASVKAFSNEKSGPKS